MEILVSADGFLTWHGHKFRCALGRTGISAHKREGDGASPAGTWVLRRVLYRPDRVKPPVTALPLQAIQRGDGWCDDPAHGDYNHPVRLPHPASCEEMWREDGLYDVVVVLGHNDDPPIPGLGSAIFMHVAKPDYEGTQGCIALALPDLLDLLSECAPGDAIRIP